jgi:hypothetical protein
LDFTRDVLTLQGTGAPVPAALSGADQALVDYKLSVVEIKTKGKKSFNKKLVEKIRPAMSVVIAVIGLLFKNTGTARHVSNFMIWLTSSLNTVAALQPGVANVLLEDFDSAFLLLSKAYFAVVTGPLADVLFLDYNCDMNGSAVRPSPLQLRFFALADVSGDGNKAAFDALILSDSDHLSVLKCFHRFMQGVRSGLLSSFNIDQAIARVPPCPVAAGRANAYQAAVAADPVVAVNPGPVVGEMGFQSMSGVPLSRCRFHYHGARLGGVFACSITKRKNDYNARKGTVGQGGSLAGATPCVLKGCYQNGEFLVHEEA